MDRIGSDRIESDRIGWEERREEKKGEEKRGEERRGEERRGEERRGEERRGEERRGEERRGEERRGEERRGEERRGEERRGEERRGEERTTKCLKILCYIKLYLQVGFGDASAEQKAYTIGPISFTMSEVVIGVIASLMVFPINLIIVQIFRLTRPRPPGACRCCSKKKGDQDGVAYKGIAIIL